MAEAKHSFIDDYPYLVYSPNAETTYDGNSGGGGGGGTGFPVIEMNTQTSALLVTARKLIVMLANSPVLTFSAGTWYQFVSYTEDLGSGTFFKAFTIDLNDTIRVLKWSASSLDDYPTPYRG